MTDHYAGAIGPLLTQRCGSCHGQAAGLDVTRYQSLMAGSQNGPVVAPGDPEGNRIVQVLREGHFARLSSEEMDLLVPGFGTAHRREPRRRPARPHPPRRPARGALPATPRRSRTRWKDMPIAWPATARRESDRSRPTTRASRPKPAWSATPSAGRASRRSRSPIRRRIGRTVWPAMPSPAFPPATRWPGSPVPIACCATGPVGNILKRRTRIRAVAE
ncbi:MAG: hypothetical protein ACP5N6_08690 [Anaerolineae bacterium]